MAIFHGNAIPSAAGDFSIDNSCRFNDDDAPGLTKSAWTSSAANRRTWTFSIWLKLGSTFDAHRQIYKCGGNDSFALNSVNGLDWYTENATGRRKPTAILRDPTAWYHIVLIMDTSNGTDDDKMRMYINGERVTSWITNSHPTLNHQSDLGDGSTDLTVGTNGVDEWDGYIAEVHFIDGTAVTNADSFGESGDYGEWKPIEYTGSHGSNGFYLDFKNTTSYATGDRRSDITVTHDVPMYRGTPAEWIQGRSPTWSPATAITNLTAVADYYIRFEFASTRTYTGYRFYNQNNGAENWGTWKWQGSNTVGGASGYVDISDNFVLSGADLGADGTPEVGAFSLSGVINSTAYLYYQLLGVSGIADQENVYEMEFATGSGSLGDDVSGNSNNFTVTNLAGSDQMTDTPTNNFCTWNALDNYWEGSTLSEGNLKIQIQTTAEPTSTATFGMTSGKWYWEIQQTATASGANYGSLYGITGRMGTAVGSHAGSETDKVAFYGHGAGGNIVNDGYQDYGTIVGWTNGDIISIAVDLDNNRLYGAKNNVWFNSGDPAAGSDGYTILAASATTMGLYLPSIGDYGAYTITSIANFGQDGTFAGTKTAGGNSDDEGYGNFYYDVPAGFKSLCSQNLTSCAVKPKEHFKIMLYDDGAGAKTFASHGIPAEVGFQPDLVWLKARGSAYEHELTDAVRGVTKALSSDKNAIETTDSTGLTAFGSDGFTVGADTNYSDTTGDGMVAWCWKANGSGSSNEDGSINTTSTSANRDAGFSISTYAGNGVAGATIGHGLSVAPNLVIVKRRDVGIANWQVGSVQSLVSLNFTDYLMLDTTNAFDDSPDQWNDQTPTASVVYLGTQGSVNASGSTYVAYCWHNVDGYSKIGSYMGNGNVDGEFQYTGFSPAYVIIKHVTTAPTNWSIYDSARDLNNSSYVVLSSNNTDAEGGTPATYYLDMLSNGFKLRNTNTLTNTSGNNYFYWAFAKIPFKNANAR